MHVLIVNPPWPGKGYGTRSQNRIIKHRSDKFLQYPLFLGYSAAQLNAGLTLLNENYTDGTTDNGYVECDGKKDDPDPK